MSKRRRNPRRRPRSQTGQHRRNIRRKPRTKNTGRSWSTILFGCFFAIIGLVTLVFLGVSPYLHLLQHERLPSGYSGNPLIAVGIGILFFIVGVSVAFFGFRNSRDNVKEATIPEQSASDRINSTQSLEPVVSPKGKFFSVLAFSVFWNVIVGIFLYKEFSLFLLIFVAIGIAGIGATVWYGLAMLNPKVSVTLHNLPLRPSASAQVSWTIDGQTDRLDDFSITLIGQEKATYRRGTDTHTDTNDFHENTHSIPLAEVSNGGGTFTLTIPENTMHTWKSHNNEIVWLLRVHGDIPKWPDIKNEYTLTVYPD